ncbi:MAG: ABC transporter permease [Acidobacteria bacterium]|nr:ABC transporter permease [Acidobacteriota bacterium]MCB9396640.1 ABC transporter permease [Acidobacteriota bacterium]
MLGKMMFKNGWRHPLRTVLTIIGVGIAISAYIFLKTVITGWYAGVEASSANRVVTRNKISLTFSLPLAYEQKIKTVPNVTEVTYGNWFGGTYIDEKNFFAQFAVDPDTYFDVYPEYLLEPGVLDTLKAERNACVVGRKLAERFKWEVGQEIRLIGTIFPGDWDFVIRGIYDGARPNTDTSTMFFNWKMFDEKIAETAPSRAGNVGFYIMSLADANSASQTCEAVDALFDNSSAETLTETESAFQLGFVSMSGSIIQALQVISFVIIAIVLLVLVNTMNMSARERMSEYGVLKTLGFQKSYIFRLILGESFVISVLGGLIGYLIGLGLITVMGKALGSFFPVFAIEPTTLIFAGITTLAVGIVAALPPTVSAIRTPIVDALREIG